MDYIKDLRKDIGHKKIILNCAGVIIVNEKDEVLFQRRSDNGLWGLPGGLLERDETYTEAAIREAKEETNLDVCLDAFIGIYHNHNMVWSNGDKAHTIGAYFLVHIIGGELKKDEESYELKFFKQEDTPPLFAKDHEEAIKAYYNGIRYPLLDENKK